ncbi:MAG TPA: efflux RND transporter permease subunit, partial [Bryobacteraceae bacterium]|nr:efflux RND transporter permease subunit [Bryobacteraceae bacterium]
AWLRTRYVRLVGHSLAKKLRYLAVYVVLVAVIGHLFMRLPTGYLPDEDQGILLAQIMMPTGATLEQTKAVANQVQRYFQTSEKEAVESCMSIAGIGFSGRAQNISMVFAKLKDWDLRDRPDLRVTAIAERAQKEFAKIRGGMVFAFVPPPVAELGNATGFDYELIDFGGVGHAALTTARNQLLSLAAKDPRLMRVRPNGLDDVPQYRVDVDWQRVGALGIPITTVHDTISTAFGSGYVNDFIQAGRVKRVYAQADAPFRMLPTDLERLYVRNNTGKVVPYSSFATGRWTSGSPRLERFNGFPSMNLWGEPTQGTSSGEAMRAMEEITAKLPKGVGFDWNGLSYQERIATSQGPILYAFSVLVIFLCVAALYESWTIPIVNLLMLPLGVLGALLATTLRGLPNDVYFQIGFLTTLGLSTKNAILIIQFIKDQMRHGLGLVDATLAAVRIRFRPVIMTSLAFFFGTLPLALNRGAGAGAMNGIGTAVTGGMLSATFIDLIFIPLFFVLISQLFSRRQPSLPSPQPPSSPEVN